MRSLFYVGRVALGMTALHSIAAIEVVESREAAYDPKRTLDLLW